MPMPTTKEGLQRLLDFFVYGMLRAAESLGNAPLFLRSVEEEGLRKFLLIEMPKFKASANAKEACEAYTKSIDEGGLFATTDTTFTGDEDTVQAEIGDLCPYRRGGAPGPPRRPPAPRLPAVGLGGELRGPLPGHFPWQIHRVGARRRGRSSPTHSGWEHGGR